MSTSEKLYRKELALLDRLLEVLIELAKFDPVGATWIYRREAKADKRLQLLGDVTFFGGDGKNSILHCRPPNTGEVVSVNAGNCVARINRIRLDEGREPSQEEKAAIWGEETYPVLELDSSHPPNAG
jgi:hypothetical protein